MDEGLGAGMHALPPGCLAALVTHLARPVPPGPALPAFPDGFRPHRWQTGSPLVTIMRLSSKAALE